MSDRIVHDEAWAAANAIVSAFASLLYEHELKDAHEVVYNQVKLAIELANLKQQQDARRIQPSRN